MSLDFQDINTICAILDDWRSDNIKDDESKGYELIEYYIDALCDSDDYRMGLIEHLQMHVAKNLEVPREISYKKIPKGGSRESGYRLF